MKTRDGMRPYNSPDKEGHASTKIEEKGISHHMQKDRSLKEPIEGLRAASQGHLHSHVHHTAIGWFIQG